MGMERRGRAKAVADDADDDRLLDKAITWNIAEKWGTACDEDIASHIPSGLSEHVEVGMALHKA